MKTILLHNITPDELKNMIIADLKSEIETLLLKANDTQNYSVQKASKLLGCSELTIYNYIKKGLLPAFKIGRHYIIKKIDIDNALKEVKSLKYRR
ncbi:helix-turn-helix domain-containing protein [Confluentibacter citreus]|uniref:helix-turn-helix domain-containing protein n=1 Tax=Confluentibacter citreus TaxID=2007307 RepID=UPI000C2820DD|nr:helix-turn-helix domain-containing protein [Confluentibacter citreus]